MAENSKAELLLRLPEPLLKRVIEYRHIRRLPSRTDAILRLITLGLDSDPAAGPGTPSDA